MSLENVVEEFSIAILFEQCLQRYREVYLKLIENNGNGDSGFSISQLADEYGRIGVWGKNSGADRTGRGSLDDRLRVEPGLRSIVSDLLKVLESDLDRCKEC